MRALYVSNVLPLLLTFGFARCQSPSPWPYNLPPDVKYYPEDEVDARRYAVIQKQLSEEAPLAVRKMAPDDGAMFFLEYWGFRDQAFEAGQVQMINASIDDGLVLPAILVHSNSSKGPSSSGKGSRLSARNALMHPLKRDFQCPSGTTSCSNIGSSDACCPNGLTCNLVANTGLGDVGCCAGSCSSGQVGGCEEGYTACQAYGGGCCIPGYACVTGGCLLEATQTIFLTPTPTPTPTPSPSTATSVSTPTTSPSPLTTSTQPACSSGFMSCPASLGGGCCASSMQCGSSTTCIPQTSSSAVSPTPTSSSIVAPARPTSVQPSSSSQAAPPSTTAAAPPSSSTSTAASVCPTGFYQCSAYYHGGSCCQVGRDCSLTSCPPSSGTAVLVSEGVTITAAPGANGGDNGKAGSCATGWYSCAASLGGSCCPTGFNCGTASCWLNATANAPAQQTGNVPKESAVSAAGRIKGELVGWWSLFAAATVAWVVGW